MCGIFLSLSRRGYLTPDTNTQQSLKNRGPDSSGTHQVLIQTRAQNDKAAPAELFATFYSTVLSLRGTSLTKQPLKDEQSGSILCWNGEAWSIAGEAVPGSDARAVFDALLAPYSVDPSLTRELALQAAVHAISGIRGPFAFVYYDARSRFLYYGRDCLGRRSLLKKVDRDLILSSVCDDPKGQDWTEVEADGIYVMDMDHTPASSVPVATLIGQRRRGEPSSSDLEIDIPFPMINASTDAVQTPAYPDSVARVKASLMESLERRVQHVREAVDLPAYRLLEQDTKVAILFSGGLDCTILARLAHDLLLPHQSVDLLNVAFQNPRIHSSLEPDQSPYELCPDRITGRSSHAELSRVCPGRAWRFVEINVPYAETVAARAQVMALMHPHNTEMDLSISYALYFASRGIGVALDSTGTAISYTSRAPVLLSGLGADELFGGYQRHAVAFARRGHAGLIEELKLDFNRLGKRNLGRDDRIISDSGKEVRFPYLDEDFISLALELPVAAKCDFGSAQLASSDDPAVLLEPGKRILRLLAWHLGMKQVAREKKRAIQFGARTAKMDTGKTKGQQVVS